MHVYIDESGDPNITKKTTKYFVFGFIICDESFLIKKILRKTKNKFKLGNVKTGYTFHANKDSVETKLYILRLLSEYGVKCGSLVMKKENHGCMDMVICTERLAKEL